MPRTARARFVCRECRRKMVGAPGDDRRRGCEFCGGPLQRLYPAPAWRRRR